MRLSCELTLVVVTHLDLIFDVTINLAGVEIKERKVFAFELIVERLQVGLFQTPPLIEQAGKWLGCDVPCLHLSFGWRLICVFDLFLDASESQADCA